MLWRCMLNGFFVISKGLWITYIHVSATPKYVHVKLNKAAFSKQCGLNVDILKIAFIETSRETCLLLIEKGLHAIPRVSVANE